MLVGLFWLSVVEMFRNIDTSFVSNINMYFFYEQECLLFVTVLKLLKELNVIMEASSSGRTNLGFDFRKPECTTE